MNPTDQDGASSSAPRPAEVTVAGVLLGLVLSVVMGAANVYLGLKAGMTVSASIPAAVISMGLLRGVLRRRSILESNLVQTAASSGESLAAGIIFTMPALVLIGVWEGFHFWTTSLIALAGGLLGVLFMVPMRRVFIADNEELKFPEGVACAEVLHAGSGDLSEQSGSTGVQYVAIGVVIGAMLKFAISFLGLVRGTVEGAIQQGGRVFYLGAETSPALLAVGYIVGLPIAVQIFMGGAIAWLVAIPLLGTEGVPGDTAVEIAKALWSNQARYIGVGAMVVGGVNSIWRVRDGLRAAIKEMFSLLGGNHRRAAGVDTRERNIGPVTLQLFALVCVLLIAGIYFVLLEYSLPLTILTTLIMLVMSFFFAAVASYLVGLVGNSNSPVSGMTITAVLGTGALVLLFGFGGEAGMIATLGVAGIVCCAACTAGDVCNDLKTGYLVGASPRNQQVMQIAGVLVAAFVMAPVMTVLHQGSLNEGTGGIGGSTLSAPQANLFASLARSFFADEALPKEMVAWGVGVGIVLLALDALLERIDCPFRLHVMPVAVGIYLPFGLAIPILIGGLLNTLVRYRSKSAKETNSQPGVLVTSGLIAGESLMGVLLGLIAYLGIKSFDMTASDKPLVNFAVDCLSLGTLLAVAALVYFLATRAASRNRDHMTK